MFSYLAGFFCHYALDSTTHPYIIWVTTEEHVFPRCHMSLEHALDAVVFRGDGFRDSLHPVTDHYFPRVRLPEAMRADLDAVYEETYGWQNCWRDMNRSCLRYRRCFRIMEHPRGFSARLASLRSQLLEMASLLELELDFSEEEVEFADRKQLRELVGNVTAHCDRLIESFRLGNAIKNGVPVAIVGNTNVGKSNLMHVIHPPPLGH
jgi:hypothetical protein